MVNDYFIGDDNQIYLYIDNSKYIHDKKNENVIINIGESDVDHKLENVCECLIYFTGKIVKDTKQLFYTYMCLFYSGDDLNTICNRRLKNME